MRIRRRGTAGWAFTRRHALAVLGLYGTGALRPARIGPHCLRVQRAGVTLDIFTTLHLFHRKLA